jgi:hypothetical protein
VPAWDVLDSSNFVLTPPTMAAIVRIDLLAIDTAMKDGAKAVLMLSAGVGRHIGQGRLCVEVARDLAARGHLANENGPA